jgi:hypothetical protein
LSKTCFVNEKLACGDQVATKKSESDEEFHTVARSPMKESTTTSLQPRPN